MSEPQGNYDQGGTLPPGTTNITNTAGVSQTFAAPVEFNAVGGNLPNLLGPTDPNIAAGQGDYDHENHIGDPCDDGESAEIARLVAEAGEPDGDA